MENNNEQISYKLLIFDIAMIFFIVFMIFIIYNRVHQSIKRDTSTEVKIVDNKVFTNLNIQAKAVYVYDIATNKVLFEKNQNTQLPLASLTKLMTALTAVELAPKNTQVTIRKEFLQEEGDSGLRDGEVWDLRKLLDFSLIVSSNDGARAVASVVGSTILKTNNFDIGRADFIQKMNDKAKTLGLNQTYFVNESGLDVNYSQSGAYGSAEDIAKILKYIVVNNPDILEATKIANTDISSLSLKHRAQNTNIDINKIPNIIGSKTGYTDLAGGNLAVVFDAGIGEPVAVVVLGSTQEGRFTDVLSLVDASMKYLRQ